MKKLGTLFLVPSSIDPLQEDTQYTVYLQEIVKGLRFFIVERVRTSRRFIRAILPDFDVNTADFKEFGIKNKPYSAAEYLHPIFDGQDIGILSEFGVPGVADPGRELIRFAHQHGIRVVPLAGPNSIVMALMSSGMNGQKFVFHGYLARDQDALKTKLRSMERQLFKTGYTQIFMETPYRNDQMIKTVIRILSPETYFCVACDLSSASEKVISVPIGKWRQFEAPSFHRRPCIFLLGN